MAFIDGLSSFLSTWSGVHTAYSFNSTNANTGTDTTHDANSSTYSSATGYPNNALAAACSPDTSGDLDIYIITDCCMLLYIPAGLTHSNVYGLFHNGGGTHAQAGFLRATATGVEICCTHNASGTPQDNVIHEIPDASLPGWFCVGFQFCSAGGSQGDMALWIDGVKERSGTRTTQLRYGSGNPQIGDSNADHPLESACLDPSDYSGGNWAAENTINGTGILIANFVADNPNNDNTSPDGNGDSFYTDYYDEHADSEDYTLTADGGTFTESGTAATLKRSIPDLVADGASYTLNGTDATFDYFAHDFVLSLSDNFIDGAATTYQLAAPSGKSTTDFDAGKIHESSNPADAVDITADDYTEIEFCFQATSHASEVSYDFRIEGLDTYTVTPQATVSSGYSLTAESGTYAESGTAAGLEKGSRLDAVGDSYVLTGTAASLEKGFAVDAGAESYTLAGMSASLKKGFAADAAAGSYAVAGTAANLEKGSRLDAESDAYTLTGTAAGLNKGKRIAADAGAYVLAGTAAGLKKTAILSAESGTFVHTGQDASLLYAAEYEILAESGIYTLTGQDATLEYAGSYAVTAESGIFSETGRDADLLKTSEMAAATVSFDITGTDADLLAGLRVDIESGVFNASGHDAGMLKGSLFSAATEGFDISGTDAALLKGFEVAAGSGVYSMSGTAAGFLRGYAVAVESGSYVLTGSAAELVEGLVREIIENPSIESLTLVRTLTSLTTVRSIESLTAESRLSLLTASREVESLTAARTIHEI